jgi:hypothetical protein
MPRPEQTPPSRFSGLPYGTNALANQESEPFNDVNSDGNDLVDPSLDEEFQPASDDEQFLFSQTDRPDEPLTAGMGFGAGPGIASQLIQDESPKQFSQRIAQRLAAEGESSPGLKKFLAKVESGK